MSSTSMPVILVVERDAEARASIVAELARRYGADYRIDEAPDEVEAARRVTALADAGGLLALVLADRAGDLDGRSLFAVVRRAFPDFESRLGTSIDQAKLAPRHSGIRADINVDVQIAINSPVTQVSRVRGVHVDNPLKLFNALLYMRPQHDGSSGGDLVLYRFTGRPRFHQGVVVDDGWVEPVSTIKYRRNCFVLFVNTPTSVHGVSPRGITSVPRRYINYLAEARVPVFDLAGYQEASPVR